MLDLLCAHGISKGYISVVPTSKVRRMNVQCWFNRKFVHLKVRYTLHRHQYAVNK